MNTPFWLTIGSCKKSPTTNKETPANADKFCMIAFKAVSKWPKVSLSIIDISSIIKTLKVLVFVSQHMKSFITWLFIGDEMQNGM